MKTKEQIEELANIIYPTNTYVSAARNEGFIKAYIVCQDHLKQELEEKDKVIRELVDVLKANKEMIDLGICDICEKQNINKSTWRSCSNCGEFFKQII